RRRDQRGVGLARGDVEERPCQDRGAARRKKVVGLPGGKEEIVGLDAEKGNRLKMVAEGEPAALPDVVVEVEVIDQNLRARRARNASAARRQQRRDPAVLEPPQ